MKLRILTLVAVTSLAAASVALAKESPGPNRPDGNTTRACQPRNIELHGIFLAGGTESFQMDVKKSNRHGRALRGPRELKVDAKTRFRRNGATSSLAAMQANDRLHVKVRGCKRATGASMELLARKVDARAPKAPTPPPPPPPPAP